jgi:hypothetical protein
MCPPSRPDVLTGVIVRAVEDGIAIIATVTSHFPSDQSSKLSYMRLRRPRSRALAVLIGLVALSLTIQLEQARVNLIMKAVITGLQHSLRAHPLHSPRPVRGRRAAARDGR